MKTFHDIHREGVAKSRSKFDIDIKLQFGMLISNYSGIIADKTVKDFWENEFKILSRKYLENEIERLSSQERKINHIEHENRKYNGICVCDICDDIAYYQALSDLKAYYEEQLKLIK